MKIYSLVISLATGVLLLASCKKDSETAAAENIMAIREPGTTYNAVGYWRGQAWELFHIAVLNRDNGTARLYVKIPGMDTASALGKFDGIYLKSGSEYLFADTISNYYLECNFVSQTLMEGHMYTNIGEAVDIFVQRR